MKKTMTARFNAGKQVLITMKKYSGKYTHIPVLNTVVQSLEESINHVTTLLTKVDSIPSQTAGNKNMARADLVSIAVKVSNVLKVYAFMKKNQNLSNFIISSESALMNQLRHQELVDYSKNLIAHCEPVTDELLDYGLTEEMMEEFVDETAGFEVVSAEPRQLISERKTINEMIEDGIDDMQVLLANQLDPLLELFEDDKEFYLAYKSARMVVDPAKRRRSDEELSIDKPKSMDG
ncbi:MAG: hypothetical protein JEZ14_08915 [Marinilabiliaceae bacterium]|nr:hypothetical protein [Marinilabiliaceae bacterium]